MAAHIQTGPFLCAGAMLYNPSIGPAFNDSNQDAGPSVTYQGDSMPDVRFAWQGDHIQNNTGVVPGFMNLVYLLSVDQIPAAHSTTIIAAAQHAASGTALTLASAPAVGIALNIPTYPFSGSLAGATAVTPPLCLDFGFAWGNVTSGSTTVTVANSAQFSAGMPLVIAHVGNSGGTAALLTWCTGTPTATTITINDTPLATNASTPIGTGDIWFPREGQSQTQPRAHMPYLAAGPALLLDSSQSIARGVVVTCSSASGVGGNIVVNGYDIYGQVMNETVAIAPASSVTAYGKKAFKWINSVTPAFTDATYNYSIGTSDVFGFHFRSDKWEYANVFWAGAFMTSSTGWNVYQLPASGDVRGTVQTSAIGGGSGIGSTASNGTVSSLAITGNRLAIFQSLPLYNMIRGTPVAPSTVFGATQT